MANLDVDVAEVRKLVELVEAHGLEEITVEQGDLAITVKGHSAAPAVPVFVPPPAHEAARAQPDHQPAPTAQLEPAVEPAGEIYDIVAPLVGVFYRAPSPDAPPFIEVGDEIEVGTEIGQIEAMKVFSSIPSEVAGEVVAIPGVNAKLVQQGDVLVRVRLAQEESAR